jgi:hypothetical protein
VNNILRSVKHNLLNIPGKRIKNKLLIIESDDWGSERIPTNEDLIFLISLGIDVYNNPFNHLDSLETENDLSALFELLMKFKDIKGNYPVITANSVTANPDFTKIKESNFREYYHESSQKTYKNKKGCENSYSLIKEGISAGIFHPQLHGREHLNFKQWLNALNTDDKLVQKVFDAGIYCIDFESGNSESPYFMAAFNGNLSGTSSDFVSIIDEAAKQFKDMFGYASDSFIAPCYIWHPSLEPYLKKNGIKFIQGIAAQTVPVSDKKYRKIYHYQGERNSIRQLYFVRNCFFEPSLNPKFNWIEDCLQRIRIAFYWGKPAIMGVHRLNFIGSLNEENRKKNLLDFSRLLKTILKTWPDVEFTTTDRLGKLY